MRCLLYFTILISFCLSTSTALGHAEVDSGSGESAELYAKLLEDAINLKIGSQLQDFGPTAKISVDSGLRKMVFGKHHIDLNQSGFWNMADALSQLYLKELEEACEECHLPTKDDVLGEVEDLIAQGWISKLGIGLGNIIFERYGLEFANLAFRYGILAGVVKVIGELVEDALLVVFKMPNAHFLCEVITYYIAVYSRTFNTFLHGASKLKLRQVGRVLATSWVIRRVLKRIEIEIPAFTVKDHELEDFLEHNEETKVFDRILDYSEHKLEARGFEKAAGRIEKYLAKRHRFNRFMERISKDISKKRAKLAKKNLSPEERTNLEKDLSVLVKISKKAFQGKRYKRYLFLKKRRQKDSLGEFAQTSEVLGGSEFWFFSLKNDLLMPHLDFEGEKHIQLDTKQSAQIEIDEIATWQALQAKSTETDLLARSLSEISFILNPKSPRRERYFHFKLFDSLLTTVLPKISLKVFNHRIEEMQFDKSSFKKAAKVWSLKFKLFKRLSRFNGKIDKFTDIMRYGAVNTKKIDITMDLHARDYYLRLLDVFKFISSFAKVESEEDLNNFISNFDNQIEGLDKHRYWVEKKRRAFSTSAITGVYRCEALY